MNKRYHLVKPILSDKIYEASTLSRGAKKCFNELKQSGNSNASVFVIRDIDTQQTYIYGINKHILTGGADERNVDVDQITYLPENVTVDPTVQHIAQANIPVENSTVIRLMEIENKLYKLVERVENLERFDSMKQQQQQQLHVSNDGCSTIPFHSERYKYGSPSDPCVML